MGVPSNHPKLNHYSLETYGPMVSYGFGDPPFSEIIIYGPCACAQGNTAGSPSSW